MIIEMLFAALIGSGFGGAELIVRYRDRPLAAFLSPAGLLYVFVNIGASVIALIALTAAGWTFGLPETMPPVSLLIVRVLTAGLGSAALLRVSFTLAHDRGPGIGPIAVLNGILRVLDGELERKRALSRLSHDDLAGLSFERDHAALTELCCHLLREFDLAEAQRLGGVAADLSHRDDLTDADKLDCFGLELSRLVGERALRQAAARLRDRPDHGLHPAQHQVVEDDRIAPVTMEHEAVAEPPLPPRSAVPKPSRLAPGSNGSRLDRKALSDV
ncbi:hypothetical protein [Actinomadura keratinilytica]|uniref:CNNM transmembrane domain-containing protein n=1 Tax=Actinomadura keratinilytica TaxID=547461 RepID=A0ABP7YSH2_9ACTN